ncbi:exporter of polyketide antibiotics [Nocardiopsis terrae]|uniref:ABC-2 type transport system permease protein n=1 Tax=Nocardiopsis terrae TaxID=372655 RepID=A0ABR9HCC4_9ACTN|nr:anibiotic ABC transporter efflux pump [Nocardiopsis terrae]MBE1456681.1 ABC-2 type transport system permease protein [Nocardiopsis terrae]GHC75594.1 exporter of polyketide antibiotics [Nocardiopsis terrae]
MSGFTGTGTLTRFILRRDRIRLSVWTLALAGTTAATVPVLDDMFSTVEERQGRAALMDTPTGIVFGGPGYGLDDYTLGPMMVNEMTMTLLIAMAVMSILHVIRHTRAEEESGRAELLRANVLGGGAPMASALLTITLVNLLIGGTIALTLIGFDLAAADSLAYGLGLALGGITFGAIAAVCAQVSGHARTASGLAFLAVGLLFMLRVVGDMAESGGNLLSWLSPFAWGQQAQPFHDLRWVPLALYGLVIVALVVAAHLLSGRRDLGAGLVAARPGPEGAGRLLRGVTTLQLHQQRGSIIVWTLAVLLFAVSFGTLAVEVEGMFETNPDLQAVFGTGVDDVIGGFLSFVTSYVIMGAAAFGALSVLRLRAEENSGRTELVLATAVGRVAWLGSALVVAALSTLFVVVAGGLGLGLGAAAVLKDGAWVGRLLEAVLAQLPAALVFGALAALVLGAAPRLTGLLWLWLGYSILATVMGGLLEFPEWAMNLSAFEILPRLPVEDFEPLHYVLYAGAVLLLGALSLVGFRNRDLATA